MQTTFKTKFSTVKVFFYLWKKKEWIEHVWGKINSSFERRNLVYCWKQKYLKLLLKYFQVQKNFFIMCVSLFSLLHVDRKMYGRNVRHMEECDENKIEKLMGNAFRKFQRSEQLFYFIYTFFFNCNKIIKFMHYNLLWF